MTLVWLVSSGMVSMVPKRHSTFLKDFLAKTEGLSIRSQRMLDIKPPIHIERCLRSINRFVSKVRNKSRQESSRVVGKKIIASGLLISADVTYEKGKHFFEINERFSITHKESLKMFAEETVKWISKKENLNFEIVSMDDYEFEELFLCEQEA
jgi:hypothetical protein